MCMLCSTQSFVIFIAGEPQSFTVQVTPNSDYPLDLYILMDLSHSMQDDLEMIRTLLDDLSKYTIQYLPCTHYFRNTISCSQKVE